MVLFLGALMLSRLLAQTAAAPLPASPCVVEVTVQGVPATQFPYHQVRIDGDLKPLLAKFPVTVADDAVSVWLDGPHFSAHVSVSRKSCARSVVLRGEALPAALEFPCLPDKVVVKCDGCIGWDKDRNYLPTQVPTIPMTAMRRQVQFTFRAAGHRHRVFPVVLHPGQNVVHVRMTPL